MRRSAERDAKRAAAIALAIVAMAACGACARRRTARVVTPRIGHSESGIASWYGEPYHGRRAANGEIYDMEKFTAAHKTYAFGTWVRVHNLDNGKDVDVRITDRGPFIRGRIIDLSRAAARQVDMLIAGLARVKLEVIRPPVVADTGTSSAKFAVQAGAFRDRANAEARRAVLEREHGSARIVERERVWRVLVGSFERIEDAEERAARVREGGDEAFVVRVE